jgi:hypothetical protein
MQVAREVVVAAINETLLARYGAPGFYSETTVVATGFVRPLKYINPLTAHLSPTQHSII